MRTRPLLLTLGATAAVLIGLVSPAAAAESAGRPEPLDKIAKSLSTAAVDGDECSITGVGPQKIVLGVAPRNVQFSVSTACDDADHAMKWAVTGDLFPGSAHASWLGACTYTYTGPAILDCPEGQDELDVIGTDTFKGNKMAGRQNAFVYAFDDANGNNRDDDFSYTCDADGNNCVREASGRDDIDSSVQLLRRTSWGKSFSVSADTVRKGQPITLKGGLTRANWDTGKNEKFAPTVKLQFKANGAKKFKTVRTVPGSGESTSVTVTAKRSGSFRFWYPGDKQTAAGISGSDHVVVKR